jgi:nitrogen PTS system EIIA component
MLLSEILCEAVVKPCLRATKKAVAIEELVDLLIEAHEMPLLNRAHILEVIAEREKSVSTGMECHLALPHGATDRVDTIIGALGISPGGIDFDCHDGLPAKIIILLVVPKKDFQAHLHTISSISRLLRNKPLREAILRAGNDKAAILRLIAEEEKKQGLGHGVKNA